MRPNATGVDWIRFLIKVRSAFAISGRVLQNVEPFADSCARFHQRCSKSATELGIAKLYLRTRSGGVQRIFSLMESGGHTNTVSREIEHRGDLEQSTSRAVAMYGQVDPAGEVRRVQIIAHHQHTSGPLKKEFEGFCNYLVQEFVLQESNAYFQLIEEGSRQSRRLLQMVKNESVQPGTAVSQLTIEISRAISAMMGAFCIIGRDQLFLEYATLTKKRGWSAIAGGDEIFVPNATAYVDFLSNLRNTSAVKIEPGNPMYAEITAILTRHLRGLSFSGESLWAVPVAYDQQTIAILMFAFPFGAYEFSNAAYNLTRLSSEALSMPSRFLFQRRMNKLIVDPIFSSRESRATPNKAFLIMPFAEKWSDDVATIVREVLASLGIEVIRADEMHGENVMEDVWKALLTSRYVVADVTGRNANVYYELGIAHTLGKKVMLLTQEVTDIPFDTRHLRHIIYSNDLSGHQSIRKGITGFVQA